MSIICKLDIACKHLARRRMTSSPSTRVREVGQGVTKKRSRVSDPAANRLSSYLHRSIANPATRKSTQFNIGFKELSNLKTSCNNGFLSCIVEPMTQNKKEQKSEELLVS